MSGASKGAIPESKDGKIKICLIGKFSYLGGCNLGRPTNRCSCANMILMSGAPGSNWDMLPECTRQEFLSEYEGKSVARASLQAALDAADSVARSMASAVTMHSCSWLQSLMLP